MNPLRAIKNLFSTSKQPHSVEKHTIVPAKWRKFTIPALLLLTLMIPLTVFLAQEVQDFRQRASGTFSVTSINVTASPTTIETTCPAVIKSRAYITTNGPGTVTYQWLRSDGATAPIQSVTFSSAGTQAVTTTWQLGGNGNTYNNWQAIKIISPNPMESNKATFTLKCRQAVGSQVTGVDVTASPIMLNSNACPTTFTFTGAITTSGPATVAYQWQRNDGALSAVQNITFSSAGTQNVSTTWRLGSNSSATFNPYNGWQSLKILSPNVATSGQANFKLTCVQPTIKITAPSNNSSYPTGTQPLITISAEANHPAGISYVTFVGNGHGCWNVTSTTSTFTCTNGFRYVESGPVQIVATMYPKDGSAPIVSTPITIIRSSVSTSPTGTTLTPTFTITPTPTKVPSISPSATLTVSPSLTQTTTPSPTTISGTSLSFSLLLHGIGAAGDNQLLKPESCQRTNGTLANPKACLSNQNPLHPERDVTVEILSSTNDEETTASGKIAYDNTTGTFKGQVALPESLKTGIYQIKIRTSKYLKRQVSNFITVTSGNQTKIPELSLVSSDVDNDNRLTILDYNIIIDCYTFPGMSTSCTDEEKARGDVNDDGSNDDFDENLFRRELSVQLGQ